MTADRSPPCGEVAGSFVWYVGYGSNLSAPRFARYLRQCRDTREPGRWAPVTVPHRLLFARQSAVWGGGGVAFLDPMPSDAITLGRAWLMTGEQFADILAQECGLPVGSMAIPKLGGTSVAAYPGRWYGCVVPLGQLDGRPMVTFTDEAAAGLVQRPPGPAYRAVMVQGLVETHGLTHIEAERYLDRHTPSL